MSQTVSFSLPRHSHIGNFDYKRQIHPERSMKLKSQEKSPAMIPQRNSKFIEESKEYIMQPNATHSEKKSAKNKLTTRSMEVSTSLNSQNVTLLTRSGKIESSHKMLTSNKDKGFETDKLQGFLISVSENKTPVSTPLKKENLPLKHKTQHTPLVSVKKNSPSHVLSALKYRKSPENKKPSHHVKSFSDGEEVSLESDKLKLRSSIIGEGTLGTKNSVVAVVPSIAPLPSVQRSNRKALFVDTSSQNDSFQQAESISTQPAEKFAWSKFQSSPDPKDLPLPSFLLNTSAKSPLSAFSNTRVKSRSVSMMDADTIKADLLPEFNNEDTETQSSQTIETSTENEESEKEPLSKSEELKTLLSTFNKIAGKKDNETLGSNNNTFVVTSSLPASNPANALKQLLGLGKG